MSFYTLPYQNQNCGFYENASQPNQPDNRRLGMNLSPTNQQQIPHYGQVDNRPRNANNYGLYYDMDTGDVNSEKRVDPVSSAILKRLDTISLELSTTVKSNEIAGMVKKEDLKFIQDKLEAQAVEISELKSEVLGHTKRLNELAELIDRNTATSVNLGQQTADLKGRLADKQSRHFPDGRGNDRLAEAGQSPKRMNIVIEGIGNNEDPYVIVIAIAAEIGITLFKQDLTMVNRMRRRDARDSRPCPVIVGFVHPHIRDNFLQKKKLLQRSMRFDKIWINADEPIEVRRLKSEFRRIAYRARQEGEIVYFNHQYIKIGDSIYYEQNLHDVPQRFKPQEIGRMRNSDEPFQFRKVQPQTTHTATRVDPTTVTETENAPVRQRPPRQVTTGLEAATNLDLPVPAPPPALYPNTDPNVKIRLTQSGLCFSGRSAFLSNQYERYFVYEDIDHRTIDHGFFFKKAMCYKRPDLADKIRETVSPTDAKDYVRDLELNPEWERVKVPTLTALFEARMSQHQDLREALHATAPHRLVEASRDPLWGGGAPFESTKYDDGTWEGFNQFGDLATRHRDEKLKERKSTSL